MNVLIAAKDQRAAQILTGSLDGSGWEVRAATDPLTLKAIDLSGFDAVFISFPFAAGVGIELLSELRERTTALLFLLIKEEYAQKAFKKAAAVGAYIITKPLSKGSLVQAVRFCELNFEHEKLLRERVAELEDRLSDQKHIDRAKLILVQGGMTEEEAHRYMQQLSMDRRMTLRGTADSIIAESRPQTPPSGSDL